MARLALRLSETKNSLYVIAGITLVLGFADLARGGTGIAAFLLSMAYCVLIPLAIWHGGCRMEQRAEEDALAEYRAAAIVALCVLGLYLITMAPSTAMWDTSEYIAAAYSFGLPHPPGNPFFVIIGHLFSRLPIATNVAA